jgi:hypothetical protein
MSPRKLGFPLSFYLETAFKTCHFTILPQRWDILGFDGYFRLLKMFLFKEGFGNIYVPTLHVPIYIFLEIFVWKPHIHIPSFFKNYV